MFPPSTCPPLLPKRLLRDLHLDERLQMPTGSPWSMLSPHAVQPSVHVSCWPEWSRGQSLPATCPAAVPSILQELGGSYIFTDGPRLPSCQEAYCSRLGLASGGSAPELVRRTIVQGTIGHGALTRGCGAGSGHRRGLGASRTDCILHLNATFFPSLGAACPCWWPGHARACVQRPAPGPEGNARALLSLQDTGGLPGRWEIEQSSKRSLFL